MATRFTSRSPAYGVSKLSFHTCHESRHDVSELLLVRAHTLDSLLRTVQLGGSDHLHRTRNLTGTLHGSDSSFYFFE
ncbi:hypothetical protein EVA_02632 [gut metagenome]|uniref:Uncharacterized protein n=1 Tax=gut metagenome TaxID=749906 RepID=J9H5L8_9ZZZZ